MAAVGTQFQCRVCNQYVADEKLDRHHRHQHPEIAMAESIFELMDINNNLPAVETTFDKEQLYVCGECLKHFSDLELSRHHSKHHPNIPLEANIYQPVENSETL